jgi:hypothetical protein
MMIRSNLFNRGHPLKAEQGLSDALERHKQSIVNKIRAISDLDQMTHSKPHWEKGNHVASTSS